jgi:large subunit ribosomal protein L35
MPKMKTNRAAKKRFRLTGTGKVMHARAFKYHKLEHKSSTRTRRLTGDAVLSPADAANAKKMLGI